MKEEEEVIARGDRLPVRMMMMMEPAGDLLVVRSMGFFVVSSTTDDPSGARDARIAIHETFPAGVLARGQQLTTRLATCHLVCQPFYHKGVYIVSSRPGGRVRHGQAPAHLALFSFFPLLLLLLGMGAMLRGCVFCRGWATISLFPMSSSPVLRCRTHQCRSFLILGLVRPTMPASVGTVIWIVARHVKHLPICVRLTTGHHLW